METSGQIQQVEQQVEKRRPIVDGIALFLVAAGLFTTLLGLFEEVSETLTCSRILASAGAEAGEVTRPELPSVALITWASSQAPAQRTIPEEQTQSCQNNRGIRLFLAGSGAAGVGIGLYWGNGVVMDRRALEKMKLEKTQTEAARQASTAQALTTGPTPSTAQTSPTDPTDRT